MLADPFKNVTGFVRSLVHDLSNISTLRRYDVLKFKAEIPKIIQEIL